MTQTTSQLGILNNRHVLTLFVLVAGCLNGFGQGLFPHLVNLSWASLTETFGVNPIMWLALVLAARLQLKQMPKAIQWHDTALALLACVGFLIPSSLMAWLILITYITYYLWRDRKDVASVAPLSIFFVLALREPIVFVSLKIFSEYVLSFDAFVSHLFINWFSNANQQVNNVIQIAGRNGFIMVIEGCASIPNMTFAVVAWVAVMRTLFPAWRRRDALFIALLMVSMLVINAIRIAVASHTDHLMDLLHNSWGRDVYDMAVLIVTIAFIFWGKHYHAKTQSALA